MHSLKLLIIDGFPSKKHATKLQTIDQIAKKEITGPEAAKKVCQGSTLLDKLEMFAHQMKITHHGPSTVNRQQ